MDMVSVVMPIDVALALQMARSTVISQLCDTMEKAGALMDLGVTIMKSETPGTAYTFEKNLVDGLKHTRTHAQLESEQEGETTQQHSNTTAHTMARAKMLKSMACRFAMNEDETIDAALEALEYLVDVAGCEPTRVVSKLVDALPEGWTWEEVGEMVNDIQAERQSAIDESNNLRDHIEEKEMMIDALEAEVEDLKASVR